MQNGGLRTRGITKSSQSDKPLITVVTVVYNGEATLEQTIKSVVNQTYDNVEYIIVDGGSKDRTLDIIKKYEDIIDYWQSEPDKGIYDAMNKGIELANGVWINFMNAGDCFVNAEVLSSVFRNNNNFDFDVLYGDACDENGESLISYKKINTYFFLRLKMINHQSMFIKRKILLEHNYDLNYKIIADREQFIWAYKEGKRISYLNQKIAQFDTNGISSNFGKMKTELEKCLKKYFNPFVRIIFYINLLLLKIKKIY